jgi:hypothetical protein
MYVRSHSLIANSSSGSICCSFEANVFSFFELACICFFLWFEIFRFVGGPTDFKTSAFSCWFLELACLRQEHQTLMFWGIS